jgi:2-hydroxychromene-2-carboxylate isomerase
MNATQGGSPIEFWFDFASGYAYFAALEIEALAERHGRSILWRPFTLGAAFKVTGAQRPKPHASKGRIRAARLATFGEVKRRGVQVA